MAQATLGVLDLEGRLMRHAPWSQDRAAGTGVRPWKAAAAKLGSLPERRIAGEAVRETLLAFEARGGDGDRLAAMLGDHAPAGFKAARTELLDPNRNYGPEYWLYFSSFSKKLLSDPAFRYRAEPRGAQLSRYHRFHERGPIVGRPWGLGQDGSPIRGLGMHNIALPLRFIDEDLGGGAGELLGWLNSFAEPQYELEMDFVFEKADTIRCSYEYACTFLSLAEAYADSSGIFEAAFRKYIVDSGSATSAGLLAVPPGKALDAFVRYRGSLSDAYENTLERRLFSLRLDVRFKDLDYIKVVDDFCLGALDMALGIHAGAVSTGLEEALGRPVRFLKAESHYGGPDDARLRLNLGVGPDPRVVARAAAGCAAALAAGGIAAASMPATSALSILLIGLGAIGALLGAQSAVASRAAERLERGAASFARQRKLLRNANEELLRERDGLEENVRARTAELEAANRRLSELDGAKTAFFANVSHELRTPVALVSMPLDAVISGRYGESVPKDAPALLLARRSAARLGRLADGLLEFLRLDSGAVEPRPRRFDLGPFAAALLEEYAQAAESRGIELSLDASKTAEAFADPDMVETIALNLLSNALKFTPPGGVVRVKAEPVEGGGGRLVVWNNGEGIAPERRELVFVRYQAAAERSRADYSGFGLGLPLSRDLARLMGGDLLLESESGAWAEFSLIVPGRAPDCAADQAQGGMADAAQGEAALDPSEGGYASDRATPSVFAVPSLAAPSLAAPSLAAPSLAAPSLAAPSPAARREARRAAEGLVSGHKRDSASVDSPDRAAPSRGLGATERGSALPRVLVVDDDREFLTFLSDSLSSGFRVSASSSGSDALDALDAALKIGDAPRAILADVMMPGIDGFRLRELAAAKPGLEAVPFIFLSARADPAARLEGLGLGALDYLEKPFSLEELEAKLASAIALADRERERIKALVRKAVDGCADGPADFPASGAVSAAAEAAAEAARMASFTGRERAIAELLSTGLSDKEIAGRLGLATRTVSNYVSGMLKKTGAAGRTTLAVLLLKG